MSERPPRKPKDSGSQLDAELQEGAFLPRLLQSLATASALCPDITWLEEHYEALFCESVDVSRDSSAARSKKIGCSFLMSSAGVWSSSLMSWRMRS